MSNTVFITGTSSGLGRAAARLFQVRGWNVVATMRRPEHENELDRLDNTLVTRLDVQDNASIHAAVDAGLERFGRIDALINNAGYGTYGPLEATAQEKIARQFDVNVLGPIATTKALLSHFRANRGGTIVNVSSIGGRITFPLNSLYHGTKFAVEGLSEALQYELAPLGIEVKIVQPGGIDTDFGGRSLDVSNDPALLEYQPLMQKAIEVLGPMMAQGSSPERIAEVVYAATVDTTGQLRWEAGADAVALLAERRASSDAAFFSGMKARFGIEGAK